jgi:transposase
MGMGRYVVDAVLLEGRSAREVARAHGISKSWIYELIRRYREGGYEALEPESRRPRSCKHESSRQIVQAIVKLRTELGNQGHDAGAETSPTTSLKSATAFPLSRRSGGFSGVRGWWSHSDRSARAHR